MALSKHIVLLFLSSSALMAQPSERTALTRPVDFVNEEITLSVGDSTATIHGIYYFRNNTDKEGPYPVVFPVYVDSATHFPQFIRVYAMDGADTITITYTTFADRGAIRMAIPLKPHGVSEWHLDYSQRIDSPRARYILTSTAAWGKPLEKGSYRFVVPANFRTVSYWPEADGVVIGDSITTLWCEKRDFMPERDMEIIWEK